MLLAGTSIEAEITRATVQVDGLGCPFCVYGLEKKLKKVEGVRKVVIDLKSGKSVLTIEERKCPTVAAFRAAVKKAGFTPRQISLTAVGTVVFANGEAMLKLRHSDQEYLLYEKGAEGPTALSKETRSRLKGYADSGTVFAITGTVHEHAGRPPGLSVDKIETI